MEIVPEIGPGFFSAIVCGFVNSRLSFRGVFWYGNCERSVGELWRPGAGHHRDNSRGAAAAQAVCGHHRQQVLPVLLQGKARGSDLATLPVHLKTAIATCREKQNVCYVEQHFPQKGHHLSFERNTEVIERYEVMFVYIAVE